MSLFIDTDVNRGFEGSSLLDNASGGVSMRETPIVAGNDQVVKLLTRDTCAHSAAFEVQGLENRLLLSRTHSTDTERFSICTVTMPGFGDWAIFVGRF